MSSTALMNTYGKRTLTLVKGEGCRVWDADGKEYIDALSGIAVCGLGHCHPDITQVITEQAQTLLHASNLYHLPPQQQAAELLCELSGMEKVFFSNSGAEANEAAIKIARKYGNEKGITTPTIITTTHSFHGRTMATLTATGNEKVKAGFKPLVTGFFELPFNDIDAIKAQTGNTNIVAIMVEPIQGEGGIRIPDNDYLPELRKICDQQGWLLILDEIQTGNGRTGHYFAFQHYDFLPDIMTTAKGLGNGMPIGACLTQGHTSTILQPGNHGSTYGGNPVACAAAHTVLQTLRNDNLCTQAKDLGEYFKNQLTAALASKKSVTEIRQRGLMIGIELKHDCNELVQKAVDKGVLLNVTANKVIRLLPALIISREQIDQIITTLTSLID
ncbi:acetylornithine aminotransferase [Candidatus Endobugula sertula]|uniref:Acetylornithine aminotransferase n=1 Tax=Candidatus Endobugula sertula TaxID=62101 RepID=A0A1D2QU48_9GAMM|nr:acetylornithine aminotransferase [Candidatus Endobugula sertula]